MMDKVTELELKIKQLQAQKRALMHPNKKQKSLAKKRLGFSWTTAEMQLHLDHIASQLGGQFYKIDRSRYAMVNRDGHQTTFVVRSSLDWYPRLSRVQKEVLTCRSWHVIDADKLNLWQSQGVDYVVFLINQQGYQQTTAFIVPMDQVVAMSKQADRRAGKKVMFYWGLDHDGNVVECRLDQAHPMKMSLKVNDWAKLLKKVD